MSCKHTSKRAQRLKSLGQAVAAVDNFKEKGIKQIHVRITWPDGLWNS
jgi:hypothetical protein